MEVVLSKLAIPSLMKGQQRPDLFQLIWGCSTPQNMPREHRKPQVLEWINSDKNCTSYVQNNAVRESIGEITMRMKFLLYEISLDDHNEVNEAQI